MGPGIVGYFVMLGLCAPAALPDYTDDGVRYHLAYAYEWFRAGRIFADHHFRFPYYTFNGEVIYAWMFVLRIGRYAPFLSWMAGTVAVLATYGLIATVDESAQRARSEVAQAAACVVYAVVPLSVAFAAVFLRWVDAAMPDAASGMFFAATAAAITLVICNSSSQLLLGAVLSGAFLAGMKPTYALLIPIFMVFMSVAGIRAQMTLKRIAIYLVLICALSSPWYVRNLIADHDPMPPLLHIALGREDPDVSRADLQLMAADLRSSVPSLRSIETYPIRLFRVAYTREFREYGVTAVVLSLYGVVIAVIFLIFKTKKGGGELALLALLCLTLGGCAYLFATSLLARYALVVYPMIAASAGCLLLYCSSALRYGILAAPVIAALLAVPSRSALQFYEGFSAIGYTAIASIMPSDQAALERQLGGFLEAEPLLTEKPWQRSGDPNVLLVNADIQYYIELYGGEPFGDWTGMTRYSDFARAIDEQNALAYLNDNHISAIVVGLHGGALAWPEVESLREQIASSGFKELASSDSRYDVFMRQELVKK
ncbi:MAG TPA: hypothetical protein VNF68_00810, partial [Candidatus Baltobacteraceae bacterium]|nr:hypothetical protein [Candidatus Baltobacteraceae bacterium]